MTSMEQRHRLKQKDLVAQLLVLFSEEYDRTEVDSIIDIELPMNTVRDYLERHVGIRYTSDTWIATQIHKYESEIGTKLFRKHDSDSGPMLGLNHDIRTYSQKQHLYVTQKIRVANGVMDLIRNEREGARAGQTRLPPAGRRQHRHQGSGNNRREPPRATLELADRNP